MDALGQALLPLPETPIAVGFSGGMDSTVLLHALASRMQSSGQALRAIHVHHGLHSDADEWAAHCERVCSELSMPLQVLRVRVDHATGRGPEGAARAARLDAFRSTLHDNEVLALAHHRDDQAETILLRLMRGAGGDGLAAMRRRSRLGSLRLWRPLLEVSRTMLQDYAMTHALQWIEDPSNANLDFDRNFLRNRVLPLLAERWPQASKNLTHSAGLLAEQSQLLAAVSNAKLEAMLDADDAICVQALLDQSRAQRARVLRGWLLRLQLPSPTAKILASIERDLLPARSDGDACVAWAGVTITRWRDRLYAKTQSLPFPDAWNTTWDGREALQMPDGASLALQNVDAFDSPLSVRLRRGGERLHLTGREHSQTLKNLLQECDVPPWMRKRMPLLLADDGELLAAGEVIISARMEQWLRAHDAMLVWHREDRSLSPRPALPGVLHCAR